MDINQVLHMNGGSGEISYAKNSSLQEKAILKAKPIVDEAILDLYCSTFPNSLGIADLGCSSGPNSLLAISQIIDAVDQKCNLLCAPSPEYSVYLNDLMGNDFNYVFRSLPAFHERRRKEREEFGGACFIAGVPGSFYGRIFPSKSLHFVHSSYALHWLSQVPPGLTSKEGVPLNKGTIYISRKSPPCVWKAYVDQFQKDFSLFFKSRSQEMVDGGRMVLTLLGRMCEDPTTKERGCTWVLIGEALNDMVSKGLVDEAVLYLFNVPTYAPSVLELEREIEKEGSFTIVCIEIFKINKGFSDDDDDDDDDGDLDGHNRELVAKILRATSESILESHFGKQVIDDLFKSYGESIGEHVCREETNYINIVISMTKKE